MRVSGIQAWAEISMRGRAIPLLTTGFLGRTATICTSHLAIAPFWGIIYLPPALIPMTLTRIFALFFVVTFSSMAAAPSKSEAIVLGGGCFWCTDAAYKLLPGVQAVTCGYAGGDEPHPTYEQVCAHATGHAEVIKIDFDPAQVSLEQLLDYFWHVHNPTQVGGQGNDQGPQYRSIILYASEAQELAAEKSRATAGKGFRD